MGRRREEARAGHHRPDLAAHAEFQWTLGGFAIVVRTSITHPSGFYVISKTDPSVQGVYISTSTIFWDMPVFRCENGCAIYRQVEAEIALHVGPEGAELVDPATSPGPSVLLREFDGSDSSTLFVDVL